KTLRQATNDLKELAVAVHNYESANGRMPPAAVRDKNGKVTVSWRVLLLPYLEQEKLYKEFRLEEPWDSDHNKKLIAKMPAIFRGTNAKLNSEWKTVYLAPIQKNSVFPPDGRNMSLGKVYDGTSNTVMFFEANDDSAVVWTRPDDLVIDIKKPHTGLIRTGQDHFLVAMCDGSVQRFRNTADAKNLVRVIDGQ